MANDQYIPRTVGIKQLGAIKPYLSGRTYLKQADFVKQTGQYFTPKFVADFMVSLITKKRHAKILEPCAGKGVFLTSLHERGFKDIAAYEIDSSLPNQSSIPIEYRDFLDTPREEEFDVIIGNPPYVRWKNMPLKVRKKFEEPYWKDKMNGLSDLLYAFIYLCLEKLKKGGELIFITPFFWTETLHANPLRSSLIKKGDLEALVTFDEIRIFEEVSSSIIIFKYVKHKSGKDFKVVHVSGKDWLSESIIFEVNKILRTLESEDYIQYHRFEAYRHPQFEGGIPWKAIPPKARPLIQAIEKACTLSAPIVELSANGLPVKIRLSELLEKEDIEELGLHPKMFAQIDFHGKKYFIRKEPKDTLLDFAGNSSQETKRIMRQRYVRLGDVADIGNGMVSGLDRAFRVEDPSKFTEKEKEQFIQVAKAENLRQYYVGKVTPYVFVNDILDECKLKRDYPHIYNQLVVYKAKLESRYDYDREIPWWHWVFLRNQELMVRNNEKILVPCKERVDTRQYARFAYIDKPCYATQDVTAIVKKTHFREELKYIVALLNSQITFTWLSFKGLSRGGVQEFSEKPLSRIPIRLVNWESPEEVKIHDSIVELVDRILESRQILPYNHRIESLVKKLYDLESM